MQRGHNVVCLIQYSYLFYNNLTTDTKHFWGGLYIDYRTFMTQGPPVGKNGYIPENTYDSVMLVMSR